MVHGRFIQGRSNVFVTIIAKPYRIKLSFKSLQIILAIL